MCTTKPLIFLLIRQSDVIQFQSAIAGRWHVSDAKQSCVHFRSLVCESMIWLLLVCSAHNFSCINSKMLWYFCPHLYVITIIALLCLVHVFKFLNKWIVRQPRRSQRIVFSCCCIKQLSAVHENVLKFSGMIVAIWDNWSAVFSSVKNYWIFHACSSPVLLIILRVHYGMYQFNAACTNIS